MKKFLVLSLVLGIASLATAGLTLGVSQSSIGAGGTTTISVISDADDVAYTAYVNVYDTAGGNQYLASSLVSVGDTQILAAAGDDASAFAGPPAHYGVKALDTASPFNITAGTQFQIVLTAGSSAGQVSVVLKNESMAPITGQAATVTIVPEPATMALLGLGALVLRRRK